MCITSLPGHLDSQAEIEANFRDDSQFSGTFGGWWKRFRKAIKASCAYGPRDIHWYHRWREMPMTLFALFGPGDSRWEESNGLFAVRSLNNTVVMYQPTQFYLSRIQYWCDWHLQIQWPLFFAFHYKFSRTGLIFGYIGCKRDADRIFWFPSMFLGFRWK